jgi:hypothetical protein
MTPIARIPRTRGAFSGLLLVLLGAWGALIPFIGPYFHFAYTPDKAWVWSSARFWLEVLPGAAVVLGGLIVLGSSRRPSAMLGALLALLGGAWFVAGNTLSAVWNHGVPQAGVPANTGLTRVAVEQLGFFTGLGALIIFFAALALGRFLVVGVREAALAERATAAEVTPDETGGTATGTDSTATGAHPVSTDPAETRADLPPATDDPADQAPRRGNLPIRRRNAQNQTDGLPATEGLTDRRVQDRQVLDDPTATPAERDAAARDAAASDTTDGTTSTEDTEDTDKPSTGRSRLSFRRL